MGSFVPTPAQSLTGRGIIFPIKLTAQGRAEVSEGWPLIESSIFSLLAWLKGTRFFLTNYGARLEELLEEQDGRIVRNLIELFIKDAITQYEPRVSLLGISLEGEEIAKIKVHVVVQIITTQAVESFIWPFYQTVKE